MSGSRPITLTLSVRTSADAIGSHLPLKSVESGQRAAIDALQQCVDTVDEKLPSLADGHPSIRQRIIDATLRLADQLVHTQ